MIQVFSIEDAWKLVKEAGQIKFVAATINDMINGAATFGEDHIEVDVTSKFFSQTAFYYREAGYSVQLLTKKSSADPAEMVKVRVSWPNPG